MAKGGYKGSSPARETSPEEYSGVWDIVEQYDEQSTGSWPFQEDDCAPKSCRFDEASVSHLTRTFPSAGNRRVFTWNFWVKLATLSENNIAVVGSGSPNSIRFNADGTLQIKACGGNLSTTARFRDFSAWYGITVAVDSTAAVATDRIKLFVNGEDFTSNLTGSSATLNGEANWNTAATHYIGKQEHNNSNMLDGLLSEVTFIDGQALSCDEFGFFDGQGIWQPKRFTGDYAVGGTANTADDVYAWGLTYDNVTGGGGWYFTTEDDSSSLGLSGNTGGHADELGGNTIGQRNGESSVGAHGTIATLNGYSAGQNARSMSSNSDVTADGNPGGPISFVWNRTNGKVWVFPAGDANPIGGGDPSNSSSTPTFLLPTTGKVAFGFVSANSNEEVTLQAISSSLFSGSHTLPKWRGVYDQTLSNNNATSTATSGGYRDVWSDELNDNSVAPLVGRNSFHIDFADNSSASALAKDVSGRGNDFAAYNFTAKVHEIASPNNPGWANPGGNWTLSNQDSNSLYQNANYSGSSNYSALIAGALANNTTYHFFLEQYAGTNDSYGGWFFSDSQSVSSTVPDELGSNTLGLRVGETGLGVHGTYATANSVTAGQDAITGFDSIRANTSTGAATFTEFVINTTVDKVWVRPVGGDWIGGGDPSNTSSTPSFSLITSNPQYFGYMAYNSGTYAHITPTAGNPSEVDCLVDSPVNGTETSTNAGGERRGNYATLNPLKVSGQTLKNANLACSGTSGNVTGTIYVSTGKHYWEFTAGTDYTMSGIESSNNSNMSYPGASSEQYALYGNAGSGQLYHNGSTSSFDGFVTGDVIGVALDMDEGKLYFYKNGSAMNSGNPAATGLLGKAWTCNCRTGSGAYDGDTIFNFGQRAFSHTPPAGYSPLATCFFPEPSELAKNPSKAFDILLWSGGGSNSERTIAGIDMESGPDMVWSKTRNHAYHNNIFDAVRGFGASGGAPLTTDYIAGQPNAGVIKSTDSTSITWEKDSQNGYVWYNESGKNYVSWLWDAGTATTSVAVGGSNSQAFDQSQRWRDNITSSNGWNVSYPVTNIFNGAFDGGGGAANNGGGGTITFTPPAAITVTKLELSCYSDVTLGLPDGTTQTIAGVGSKDKYVEANIGSGFSFTGSNSITISRTSSFIYLERIRINGKELVDDDVSVNTPEVACDVRANPEAGFSIVKVDNPNSTEARVHGLSKAPDFIIAKATANGNTQHYHMFHSYFGKSHYATFTGDAWASSDQWGSQEPNSTSFYVKTNTGSGANFAGGMIYYIWHAVENYSAMGSYIGNGVSDGPMVHLGFEPKWLMIKSTDTSRQWRIYDTTREPFNEKTLTLHPSVSNTETHFGSDEMDFLSNGFKIRSTGSYHNSQDKVYLYVAFAAHPFASNNRAH